MNKDLIVSLGPSRALPWLAVPEGYRVIGTVRRGMEMGQLAVSPEGLYMQANGSMLKPLNASKVEAAIRKAEKHQGISAAHLLPSKTPAAPVPAPVVVVRKRRKIVMPGSETE